MSKFSDQALDELRKHIELESRAWAAKYVAERKEVLRKRGVKATGELIDSLSFAVNTTLNSAVTNTIELAFEEHGRWRDMKRIEVASGGTAYIESLAQWIQRKGLYESFLKKYMLNRRLKNPGPKNQVLNNMAWGIARSRKGRPYRRTAWYAKSSTAAVTDLFNQVAAGLPAIVAEEIKAAFQR